MKNKRGRKHPLEYRKTIDFCDGCDEPIMGWRRYPVYVESQLDGIYCMECAETRAEIIVEIKNQETGYVPAAEASVEWDDGDEDLLEHDQDLARWEWILDHYPAVADRIAYQNVPGGPGVMGDSDA